MKAGVVHAKNDIRYDQILFDMPMGERIVVNDRKPSGIDMAVVIDDGHLGCMFVIEALRRLGLQQEIFVVELFHDSLYFKLIFYVLFQ